ncbi:MAG: radical SAM protein [Candidatus Omnitrophota bacterium]
MKPSVYIINCPPFWLKTPALGPIYLKNYLNNNSINAEIIDLSTELFKLFNLPKNVWLNLNEKFENNLFSLTKEKFPQTLNSLYQQIEKTDFIGFSILKRNWPFSSLLAEKISQKFPDKKIIFGGPHTYFLAKENKLNKTNFWVIGEGEISLLEIIKGKKQKIYYFEELTELDSLPFLDFGSPGLYSNCIPLISSRGCPHNCNFCSEKQLSKKFKYHSPIYMIEEIKYLLNKYKINNFVFCDSLINYNYKWLVEFCGLIIKNKLNIKWEAQARINKNITPELAKLMRQSGCYNLFIGLESGSDKILKIMNKGFNISEALCFFQNLKSGGLNFEISLIFGYPQETEDDFQQTLKFIVANKKIIPKIAQANPFIDYLGNFPNTKFPTEQATQRINKFIKIIQKEKIRYTKNFINNLIGGRPCVGPK